MYKLDNFILFAAEKDQSSHMARWANDGLFKSINTKKHKLSYKIIDILLSQLGSTTQILILTMNKDIIGFCEMYHIDQFNKTCHFNIHLDQMAQSFVLHGFKIIGMICNYLYNIAGMNKISTDIMLEDGILVNSFKQRGFKIEVHKRAHKIIANSYKTVVELSLLRSEANL